MRTTAGNLRRFDRVQHEGGDGRKAARRFRFDGLVKGALLLFAWQPLRQPHQLFINHARDNSRAMELQN